MILLRVELLRKSRQSGYHKEVRATYSWHRVQGNRLETDQIVAGWDRLGDCCRPGGVVSDHFARSPLAIVHGSRQETSLLNLEPGEGLSVDTRAGRTGACGEVGQLHYVSVQV